MWIIKKFVSFSLGTWGGAVIGVITIPLMTRLFLPEELGKASMFTLALNMLMIFLLFGVDQAFVRFFYEEDTRRLLKKCLSITFTVYLISLIPMYCFRKQISVYLFDVYDPVIMLTLGISSLLYALNNYALSLLRMQQLSWQYSIAQLGLRLYELSLIILLYYLLGNGYNSIVLAKVFSIFLVTVHAGFMYQKASGIPAIQPNTHSKGRASRAELLRYSYPLALTAVLTWLLQSVDKLAIKQWSTFEELGVYVAAFRVITVLEVVVASFSVYWTPLALERFLTKQEEENNVFFQKANSLISLIMLVASSGIILCKDLLILLLGADYAEATTIIPFLVFFPLMYLASETTVMGINFYKKVRWHIVISTTVLCVSLATNFLLVPILGAKGAAIAIGLSYIVYFILRTHIAQKYLKIRYALRKFYSLTTILFTYAVYSSFFPWSILNTLAGAAFITLTIYLYKNDIKYALKTLLTKA